LSRKNCAGDVASPTPVGSATRRDAWKLGRKCESGKENVMVERFLREKKGKEGPYKVKPLLARR